MPASEAKNLAQKNEKTGKILEDIEAAISGAAEEGDFGLLYTLENPNEKITEELQNAGYTVTTNYDALFEEVTLNISWRMA